MNFKHTNRPKRSLGKDDHRFTPEECEQFLNKLVNAMHETLPDGSLSYHHAHDKKPLSILKSMIEGMPNFMKEIKDVQQAEHDLEEIYDCDSEGWVYMQEIRHGFWQQTFGIQMMLKFITRMFEVMEPEELCTMLSRIQVERSPYLSDEWKERLRCKI